MAPFGGNASNAIWWPTWEAMQVAPADDTILNQCHLVDKFANDASSALLLPNLVQVTESISGSVVPLAMFIWYYGLIVCWYYAIILFWYLVFGTFSIMPFCIVIWYYATLVLCIGNHGGY